MPYLDPSPLESGNGNHWLSLFCLLQQISDSDEAIGPATPEGTPKGKERKSWKRGANATAESRARQFRGIMEVRGDLMWCIYRDVSIEFKVKSTAANHVKCAKHKKNVEEGKSVVKKPRCFFPSSLSHPIFL